jgi:hypothetical protein
MIVRPRTFSALAIVWLLALTAYEIYHFVQGAPWPGYMPVVNYMSFFYAAIFLFACYRLARYQMSRPVFPMIAFLAAFVHGAVIRVGSGWQGYYLIPSGIILFSLGWATIKNRKVRVEKSSDFASRRAA